MLVMFTKATINKGKLHPVKRTVRKDGKTFQQTFWIATEDMTPGERGMPKAPVDTSQAALDLRAAVQNTPGSGSMDTRTVGGKTVARAQVKANMRKLFDMGQKNVGGPSGLAKYAKQMQRHEKQVKRHVDAGLIRRSEVGRIMPEVMKEAAPPVASIHAGTPVVPVEERAKQLAKDYKDEWDRTTRQAVYSALFHLGEAGSKGMRLANTALAKRLVNDKVLWIDADGRYRVRKAIGAELVANLLGDLRAEKQLEVFRMLGSYADPGADTHVANLVKSLKGNGAAVEVIPRADWPADVYVKHAVLNAAGKAAYAKVKLDPKSVMCVFKLGSHTMVGHAAIEEGGAIYGNVAITDLNTGIAVAGGTGAFPLHSALENLKANAQHVGGSAFGAGAVPVKDLPDAPYAGKWGVENVDLGGGAPKVLAMDRIEPGMFRKIDSGVAPASSGATPAPVKVKPLSPYKTKKAEYYKPKEVVINDGTPTNMYELGSGINATFKVDFDLGGEHASGVWKPVSGEADARKGQIDAGSLFIRERAAYEVSEMLNLNVVPPCVVREINGQVGSVLEWADGRTASASHLTKDSHANVRQDSLLKIAVLDFVIGNTDRHRGNFMVDNDGNAIAIDHGYSLPYKGGLSTLRSEPWRWTAGDPIPASVTESLKAVDDEKIVKAMKKLGIESMAIDGLLDRLHTIQGLDKMPNYLGW
jgi:hypothetical protein